MTLRLFGVSLIAATVTFGLFWVMQALIGAAGELLEEKPALVVDFVRLKRDTEPEMKKREIPDRKPPEQPPPPPQMNFSQNLNPDDAIGVIVPDVDVGLELAAADLGSGGSDRDVVPLVRVEPQYPMSAKQRGVEGWVELRFTITKAGTVENIVVTASNPGTIFNRSAVQAVSKWKYNPKIENGTAVDRPGVRQRIKFELPR
ncbi:MAG: energy transducer TonB [Deltaproteobacteria bacterium]|nr:energy transducer TonB [Deltaproteobacteria bacterium]MBW2398155.1 energy transducer TonB [Deltaproteobacteria bacterium]